MTFYRMKLAVLDQEIAINADELRAVLPAEEVGSYHVWLVHPLEIQDEVAKRVLTLGGVLPVNQNVWKVSSTDLEGLFSTRV